LVHDGFNPGFKKELRESHRDAAKFLKNKKQKKEGIGGHYRVGGGPFYGKAQGESGDARDLS